MNKDNIFIPQVFWEQGMLNIEQGVNIWHLLTQVELLGIEGDVIECGVGFGHGLVIIRKTLDQLNSTKRLVGYDSCQGLPEPDGVKDCGVLFKKGAMPTTIKIISDTFGRYNTKTPEIIEGWFEDTLPTQLPDKIAFAHLDGDFYSSIHTSLKYVYPKLSKGAVVVVDDYYDPIAHKEIETQYNRNLYVKAFLKPIEIKNHFSGVKLACDEFFADKPEKPSVLVAGMEKHAYFRKI